EAEGNDKAIVNVVRGLEYKTHTEQSGRFIASVEAVNKDGQVLARTTDRVVEIKPMPILSAQQYEESLSNPIKSSRNGSAEVSWKAVEGAKGYILTLKDDSGKVVKEEKALTTRVGLTRLLPGSYSMHVQALDHGGRKGR